MRKLFLVFILFYIFIPAKAQQKRVLIEEFTGTACGNCPMGVYYIDSMQAKYKGVIAVSLHAFQPYDAMNFSNIDSLFSYYAGGVPCGSIDRILWPGGKGTVARQLDSWDTIIRNRLQSAPLLTVTMEPEWNSVTRDINAHVNIDILNNMPSGDYRINLYIVEDSVTGTGAGYDQLNYYDKTVGNPFYGKGNPIVGYVHRHVARVLLPSAWGFPGDLPATLSAGQNISLLFNYTLPTKYNAERVRLIAYVYRYSIDHKSDEVFNADEKKLISPATSIAFKASAQESFQIYPNPASEELFFSLEGKYSDYNIRILNAMGQEVFKRNIRSDIELQSVNLKSFSQGIYSVQMICGDKIIGNKLLVINK